MLANRIRLAAPRFARSLATEAPPAGCPFSKASMDVVKATGNWLLSSVCNVANARS